MATLEEIFGAKGGGQTVTQEKKPSLEEILGVPKGGVSVQPTETTETKIPSLDDIINGRVAPTPTEPKGNTLKDIFGPRPNTVDVSNQEKPETTEYDPTANIMENELLNKVAPGWNAVGNALIKKNPVMEPIASSIPDVDFAKVGRIVASALLSSYETVGDVFGAGMAAGTKEVDQAIASNLGLDDMNRKLLVKIKELKDQGRNTARLEELFKENTGIDLGEIMPGSKVTKQQLAGAIGQIALDLLTAGTYGKTAAGLKTGQLGKAALPVASGVNKALQSAPPATAAIRRALPKIGANAAIGYGMDVTMGMQENEGLNSLKPGIGTAAGTALGLLHIRGKAVDSVAKMAREAEVWNELGSTYQKTLGFTSGIEDRIARNGYSTEDISKLLMENRATITGDLTNDGGQWIKRTAEEATRIRNEGKALNEGLRLYLDDSVRKNNLEDFRREAIDFINKNEKNATYAKQKEAYVNKFIDDEIARARPNGYQGNMLTDAELQDVKAGMYDKGRYKQGVVNTEADAARAIGYSMKKRIENNYINDINVQKLNNTYGKYMTAADALDALDGRKVPRGSMDWSARVLGGFAMYRIFGKIPVVREIAYSLGTKLMKENQLLKSDPERAMNKIFSELKREGVFQTTEGKKALEQLQDAWVRNQLDPTSAIRPSGSYAPRNVLGLPEPRPGEINPADTIIMPSTDPVEYLRINGKPRGNVVGPLPDAPITGKPQGTPPLTTEELMRARYAPQVPLLEQGRATGGQPIPLHDLRRETVLGESVGKKTGEQIAEGVATEGAIKPTEQASEALDEFTEFGYKSKIPQRIQDYTGMVESLQAQLRTVSRRDPDIAREITNEINDLKSWIKRAQDYASKNGLKGLPGFTTNSAILGGALGMMGVGIGASFLKNQDAKQNLTDVPTERSTPKIAPNVIQEPAKLPTTEEKINSLINDKNLVVNIGVGRATKTNNPGNLVYAGQPNATKSDEWFWGVDDKGKRKKYYYAQYQDPKMGLRGAMMQVKIDQEKGLTLAEFIKKYATDGKASIKNYTDFVSSTLNVKPTDKISDMDIMELTRAMIKMESQSSFSTSTP